jgi:hypothetical protein
LPARKFTVAALGAAALLVATPMSAAAKPVTAPAVTAKSFNARAFAAHTSTHQAAITAAAAPKLLTDQVALPFNLAVDSKRLLVADGGPSTLSRILGDGSLKTVANGPLPSVGGEVAGVAISKNGKYYAYTTTEHPSEEENANGTLHIVASSNARLTVNLAKYEANHNPDKVNTYGTNSTNPCVLKALAEAGIPAKYKGLNDSHPYSVTAYGKSSWIVADAGGNDLLKVDARGRVSTLAVLRPQPVKITKELAEGLPDCVIGITYKFEPVPTDVEVGAHGRLYVSTLQGGAGGSGGVYRVSAKSGHLNRIASGFAGATNLAVYRGKIYVADLFANQISTVKNGKPKPYVTLNGALSVESGRGHLYAGTLGDEETQAPGTVVRLK